jgi:hypothetical protein
VRGGKIYTAINKGRNVTPSPKAAHSRTLNILKEHHHQAASSQQIFLVQFPAICSLWLAIGVITRSRRSPWNIPRTSLCQNKSINSNHHSSTVQQQMRQLGEEASATAFKAELQESLSPLRAGIIWVAVSLTSSPLLFSTSRKSKRLSSYSPVLRVSARDEGSGAATATLLFKLGICGERIVWSEWLYGCRERYLLESGTNTATDQPLGNLTVWRLH